MGKQAKKKNKSEAEIAKQRRHNRSTKGVNTRKQGSLWALRQHKVKNDENKDVIEIEQIRVPYDAMWNPFDSTRYGEYAQEPFDSLSLNWVEEIQHYAIENEAKLDTVTLANGKYLHKVIKQNKDSKVADEVLFQIETSSRLLNNNRGPRRRSRRKA